MENSAYVLEYARDGRSKCKGACKEFFANGDVRFGSVLVGGFGSGDVTWFRCLDCVTSKVAGNVAAKHGDAGIEDVPGFDRLNTSDKTRVLAKFNDLLEELKAGLALKLAIQEAKERAKAMRIKKREAKAAAAVKLKAKKAAAAEAKRLAAPGKKAAAEAKKAAAAVKKKAAAQAAAEAAASKKRAREALADADAEAPAPKAAKKTPAKKSKKKAARRRS